MRAKRTSPSRPWSYRHPSRRQLLALMGFTAAAATMPLSSCSSGTYALVCQHQRNGEVYGDWKIAVGSTVTHSWVHSIELSRWTDYYRFTGDGLLLTSTEFEAYGAGMPLDEGDLRNDEGKVIIENIDRPFEAVRWIHSHAVDYRIGLESEPHHVRAEQLPDGEPIELRPK